MNASLQLPGLMAQVVNGKLLIEAEAEDQLCSLGLLIAMAWMRNEQVSAFLALHTQRPGQPLLPL